MAMPSCTARSGSVWKMRLSHLPIAPRPPILRPFHQTASVHTLEAPMADNNSASQTCMLAQVAVNQAKRLPVPTA